MMRRNSFVSPSCKTTRQGGAPDAGAELGRMQARPRILLKGGVVLTLDRQVRDFARADVLIEDGKIAQVRPNIEVSGDEAAVVDAANRIVIPGFVDTQSHSYQGLLRNILISAFPAGTCPEFVVAIRSN
jgi:5-methylthioadenosine/S-adenosylhomocysteine deaminase